MVILSAPAYIIGTAIAWCIKAVLWLAFGIVLLPLKGLRYLARREAQRPTTTTYTAPTYYWHPHYGWQPAPYPTTPTVETRSVGSR